MTKPAIYAPKRDEEYRRLCDTGVLASPPTLTSMVFLTAEIIFSSSPYCIFLTKTLSQERRKNAKKTTIPLIRLTHNFQKPPVSRKKILASPLSTQFNLHSSILQNKRWNFFHTLDPAGTLYGKAPPWGPTTYPFIYHFCQKRYPFPIPSISIGIWYPFLIIIVVNG